jgi:hypothetical protein
MTMMVRCRRTHVNNSDFGSVGSHFDVCIAGATGEVDREIGELRAWEREKRQLAGMGTRIYTIVDPRVNTDSRAGPRSALTKSRLAL